MHELSITESILEIATRHALAAGATRVTDLHIVIGRLASIVDDSVQFYWEILTKDTLCAGSTLHFTRLPARLACLNCGNEYTFDGEMMPCPKCGSAQVKVLSGEEFRLDSIEVVGEEEKEPDEHS
jgi:hydrogenase nickel incorporation protein HypA/HybF